MAIDKRYDPAALEAKWYPHWEESGAFRCGQRPEAEPYCIVIPPPNVTGHLHMGHALDCTIQDILIRFERLRGKDVLWQPGMDHAGIATQMVVERQLDREGKNRREMGREAFLKRVWAWKEESGGAIARQLRRLGASCDWSRDRFTMDEGFSAAVIKTFVTLYEARGPGGRRLIYRDKRLVNWDPKLKTAISDLEVEQREVEGKLWHFRYPLEDGSGHVVVATTRPETMLGDTAVAVHPDDDRYRDMVGKCAILPLVGRKLPIIADEWADPEQGSGAVKITPAHDFNDFEVGKRHGLGQVNIFDEHAHLNDNVPEAYRGLERYEAREKVLKDLESEGVLVKVEENAMTLPYGDRSGVVIEPWLTDQWYVDAATLAGPAIEAVEQGRTRIVPKRWEKVYFDWMRNIQPWCVSRQLWWGHRIPAWYGPKNKVFVAESKEAALKKAQAELGDKVTMADLNQDQDVLDTWFSSALWPFATLGWPEETPELARYYPGQTLVTGFDIIFFWVARMMMSGLHLRDGQVPFENVYIHALITDETGQKMSKSRGNTVDPLEIVEKYGADALRFTLASQEAQGRDIKLSETRIEGNRNFGTKLWNAARFAEMNGCTGGAGGFDPASAEETVNRWIIGETAKAAAAVTGALEAYRFNEAANAAYAFTWRIFCDWYLELVKPVLMGADDDKAEEARRTTAWVLDQILRLLHPFMPFITEELWHALAPERAGDLILDAWPEIPESLEDAEVAADIDWLIGLVTEIRSVRSDLNVPAAARIEAGVGGDDLTMARVMRYHALVCRLARLKKLHNGAAEGPGIILTPMAGGEDLALALGGVLDFDAERARLTKEIAKTTKEIKALEARLENKDYIKKAPPAVVEKARASLADEESQREKLEAARARLG